MEINNSMDVVKKEVITKKRIDWIDKAKGIGIILVMLGHCYLSNDLTFWFFSFHMPLFFLLSGYTFSGKGKYFDFLKKKMKTLLVPYIFFVIITMCCNGILAITHNSSYAIIAILKLYILQCRYTPLWFITCLFISEQLMYLVSNISKMVNNSNLFFFSGLIWFLIFYFYKIFIDINLPWNMDLSLLACAFMCIGKWSKEINLFDKIKGNNWSLCVVISIVSILISGINYFYYGKVDWYSNAFGNPILYLFSAVIGVFTTILISMNIKSAVLTALGRNSLLFFGLHRIIIDLTFVFYNKLGFTIQLNNYISLIFALFSVIITIAILWPINYIVLKYLPWCLGKK